MNEFLPINKQDMDERGWDSVDFVYITGDSYVDHPSFGAAIITRVLENEGFKVAVLSQPDWRSTADFVQFGRPRLGFFITSGNIDSMVAHYTAAKRLRHDDAYTAGGVAGKRPDRAVIVYSNMVKSIYPDCPVIIGGLEASLRRFAHYDYWDDKIRPSILIDSKADLISYGMGEKQTVQIALTGKIKREGHLDDAIWSLNDKSAVQENSTKANKDLGKVVEADKQTINIESDKITITKGNKVVVINL